MSCTSLKRTALALEDLEPVLWGTLSTCLLELVFLRLPVAQISRLRLLSKLWKAAIDSVESPFNRLLEEKVYPNLFGLIALESSLFVPCVWMFDVNQDRWCGREIDCPVGGRFTLAAADGGLVCFVSNPPKDSLTIVVMNPLTGKKVVLPRLLCLHYIQPPIVTSMLHLKVNRKNNHYLVFFVGDSESKQGPFAEVYDSQTKEWSIVDKSWGLISGHLYSYGGEFSVSDDSDDSDHSDHSDDSNGDSFHGFRRGPGLYDFTQGQLETAAIYDVECDMASEYARVGGPFTVLYATFRDRLFLFHPVECENPSILIQEDRTFKNIISEYHLPRDAAAWVDRGTHDCEPINGYPVNDHIFCFDACNGYLMVMAQQTDLFNDFLHVWLYNLSTYNWHILPDIPGFDDTNNEDTMLMCELRWSAAP